ncbi:two-component system chemotaxis response regulator CheB [Lysinibacillus composti]|uniref:Protein-glutamate methylesterase/protein-glutamine glutaminase n=2 Tax=Lysinibacillus composti TaxID=720633 RepID=A0A3N9UFK3_9BACI|nr:chemotaxis response regulator protein-glutamate methylesterase [Lysinibacillus composti]MBM7608377.1 two-component system chemotaxis response regulator CheB [Lysinibacillus composti]RQW74944.1 chemotaxis response regulator protein-glutamate methylesterase [Lysinibacillus composti]
MVSPKKSKLLIVDDSAFMRKLIRDFFDGNKTIEVVGTARNGKDALKKIEELNPDIVTMDVEMPELNGLDALKEIMEVKPLPIIMLSSSTKQGAESTLAAMENGAVDFVTKPGGTISLELHKVKEELVHKVEQAVHVSVAKLKKQSASVEKRFTTPDVKTTNLVRETSSSADFLIQSKRKRELVSHTSKVKNDWSPTSKKIVCIGTSTGGPRALQEVVTQLPATIQAPILIVQHMPAGFTKSLAERLNNLSKIQVKEAEQGEILQNGTAYIAPGGYHLKLKKVGTAFEIELDSQEPPRSGHRPAVDVLFEAVSQFEHVDKIAVIMTGMGQDGSKGLVALKQTGNTIAIAESQETCIVYGMPKAAVETELVDEIVEVDEIAQAIMKYLP